MPPDTVPSKSKPPVFVSGGKRMNFDRHDEYEQNVVHEDFRGYGKSDSTYPSASWEELCAFATLIVNHPAYVEPSEPANPYYPPTIEDEHDA